MKNVKVILEMRYRWIGEARYLYNSRYGRGRNFRWGYRRLILQSPAHWATRYLMLNKSTSVLGVVHIASNVSFNTDAHRLIINFIRGVTSNSQSAAKGKIHVYVYRDGYCIDRRRKKEDYYHLPILESGCSRWVLWRTMTKYRMGGPREKPSFHC